MSWLLVVEALAALVLVAVAVLENSSKHQEPL
jgi:hypothetical protein